MPYQENGFRANFTNKAAFSDYAIAADLRGKYDGIVIGVFNDIYAIDINHCIENGVLSDMAEDIIARMDSYTEYSPHGTDMRILFKASLTSYDKEQYYINNRSLELEVYVSGYTRRFVTVTGNAISCTSTEDRTKALTRILRNIWFVRESRYPMHLLRVVISLMILFWQKFPHPSRLESLMPIGMATCVTAIENLLKLGSLFENWMLSFNCFTKTIWRARSAMNGILGRRHPMKPSKSNWRLVKQSLLSSSILQRNNGRIQMEAHGHLEIKCSDHPFLCG